MLKVFLKTSFVLLLCLIPLTSYSQPTNFEDKSAILNPNSANVDKTQTFTKKNSVYAPSYDSHNKNYYYCDSLLTKYLIANIDVKFDSLFKNTSALQANNELLSQQQLKNHNLLVSKLNSVDSTLSTISKAQFVTCKLLDSLNMSRAAIQSLNKGIRRTKRIAATAAVLSGLSLATATSFYFIMSNNKHSSNTNEVIIEW